MTGKTEHLFHITGMHCASCVVLIEEQVKNHPGVAQVKVSLAERTATISGEFPHDREKLAGFFTELVKEHGYSFSLSQQKPPVKWGEFIYALPIAVVLIAGFILLQRFGLVDLIGGDGVTYGTAFVVGLIASVSTCLAVVGGLLLSLSASYAKSGRKWRPQIFFHVGRLVGFFLLGGAIGALGTSFTLGSTGSLILGIIVMLVMIILGINLLDVFHFTKRLQLRMPGGISRILMRREATNMFAPLLIGAATFFLPCGFTQSMQVYALSAGGFIAGGLTMLIFALGTLPVLALISSGAARIAQLSWKGIFFKTAGLVVIALAVFNGLGTLAALGIIDPIFNF